MSRKATCLIEAQSKVSHLMLGKCTGIFSSCRQNTVSRCAAERFWQATIVIEIIYGEVISFLVERIDLL